MLKYSLHELLNIQNNIEEKTNSKIKVSINCRSKNPGTNFQTALTLPSMVVSAIVSVFLLKLSLKTSINQKKLLII